MMWYIVKHRHNLTEGGTDANMLRFGASLDMLSVVCTANMKETSEHLVCVWPNDSFILGKACILTA
jgi:hypothetical protein